jgi:Uma2 family endonuclease
MAARIPEVTAVERRPATWEEYEALGEVRNAEFVDGCIVMSPLPGLRHQLASRRLANALEAVLSDEYAVVETWGWKPGRDEFGPDVMVVRAADITTDVRFSGVPVLCVEILSSNRAHDLITKTAKYAEAGLDHYWILDPVSESMEILVRDGVHYRSETTVTRDAPADVSFGVAAVRLDVPSLFR